MRLDVNEGLTSELEILRELQKISVQLISEGDEKVLHNQILRTAMTLMKSDFASMQMYQPLNNELILIDYHGFHPEAAETWKYISLGSHTSCGAAAASRSRIIHEDLEDPIHGFTEKQLKPFRQSGIRSCQSTPLLNRKGEFLGMISTHWGNVHQPSEMELQVFDILARQAADLIDHYQYEQKLRNNTEQFYQILNQSPYGVTVLQGEELLLTFTNKHWMDIVQKDRSCIGKPLLEILPLVKGSGMEEIIREVMITGKPYRGNEVARPVARNGKIETGYFNFVHTPFRNNDHVITGVISIVEEVTEKVLAKQQQEKSEARFRNLMQKANVAITLYSGPEFIIEAVNEKGLEILCKPEREVVNKKLDEIEVRNLVRLKKILSSVFETGIAYKEDEISMQFLRKLKHQYGYFNFIYEPIVDCSGKITGVLCIGMEVTEQVLARMKMGGR